LNAENPEALLNRGLILLELKCPGEALGDFERALALQPERADIHVHRGDALMLLGRPREALASYDQALAHQPDRAEALCNRGYALSLLGRPGEALASYDRALALEPGRAAFLVNRGAVLLSLNRPQEALASFDRALAIQPDHVDAYLNRGGALVDLKRPEEAVQSCDLALALDPTNAQAYTNRGLALHLMGRHQEALASYDQALAYMPGHRMAHSNKIFLLDYIPDIGFAEQQEERRKFFQAQVQPALRTPTAHSNGRDPSRRLVLGYVSADFKRHSAASCFGPILRRHRKEAFKVVCYSGVLAEDDWTQGFRQAADEWRLTTGLSDGEMAAQIQADGVDILIDLSGHSRGNRLLVFARKPAPVQVTAWGHAGGTGLPMIDYQFTDPVIVPACARHLFAEECFDLPCCITFESPAFAPPVGELPALSRGFLTFGSLNRFNKVTPAALDLWAQVLSAVPGSRLLLKDSLFDLPGARAKILTAFTDRGISGDRVETRGFTSHRNHLAAFGDVDIVLDTFPQNGGITTWEALWMGVPVIAILGSHFASRISGAILHSLGLQDWVADDEAGYLALAVQKALDLESLARFREGSRARISACPSGNPDHYTRAVEAAYRAMWTRWASC
jgi:predicted O-linked N-acetylglucosamine transferase (SPINDLY family)